MAFNNKSKTLQPNKSAKQHQNEIMRRKVSEYGYRQAHTMRGERLHSAYHAAYDIALAKNTVADDGKGIVKGIVDKIAGAIGR